MRNTLATIVLALLASGCAGFLSFLDGPARDIAKTVLECVPVDDPDPGVAGACFDAIVNHGQSLESSATGETVVRCAEALRRAQALRREGLDATEAEQEAAELVELLRPAGR